MKFWMHFIWKSSLGVWVLGCLALTQACSTGLFHSSLGQDPEVSQEFSVRRALLLKQIYVGMSMQEVKSLWGTPQRVEIAGDVRLKNQKWIYDPNLLKGSHLRPVRILYFESGQVAGWENLGLE